VHHFFRFLVIVLVLVPELMRCIQTLSGLPAPHHVYVKNIVPGLPLFLFNYSERKLYGIFEATSEGQMNINPYGWTTNGSGRTQFPAQVLNKVSPIIAVIVASYNFTLDAQCLG
jgi:hypothetical protein